MPGKGDLSFIINEPARTTQESPASPSILAPAVGQGKFAVSFIVDNNNKRDANTPPPERWLPLHSILPTSDDGMGGVPQPTASPVNATASMDHQQNAARSAVHISTAKARKGRNSEDARIFAAKAREGKNSRVRVRKIVNRAIRRVYGDQIAAKSEYCIITLQNNSPLEVFYRYCMDRVDSAKPGSEMEVIRSCVMLLDVAMSKLDEFRRSKNPYKPPEDDATVVNSVKDKIKEWRAVLGDPTFTHDEGMNVWKAFNSNAAAAGINRPKLDGCGQTATILLSQFEFGTKKYSIRAEDK
jgi:hypothetical protein